MLILGGVVVAGCVSNDDKFRNTVKELSDADKPELNLLGQSIAGHDFNASLDHCRTLIPIYDMYIPRLSAIDVSEKNQLPKQYVITGFDNQRSACQYLLNRTDGSFAPTVIYLVESGNNFEKATRLWPEV
jgi:hypothetical protein